MRPPRLTVRDYKRARRSASAGERMRDFAAGLTLGLCVAGVVYLAGHRPARQDVGAPAATASSPIRDPATPPAAAASGRLARHARASAGAAAASGAAHAHGRPSAPATPADADAGVGKFQFYQMLPRFEVVVAEDKEHASRPPPGTAVDRPGTYYLQAGSYRDPAIADKVRARLAHLGIRAKVQRVAIDTDVWHRVRIGPLHDLKRLNQLRTQLRRAGLDALVIRIGG